MKKLENINLFILIILLFLIVGTTIQYFVMSKEVSRINNKVNDLLVQKYGTVCKVVISDNAYYLVCDKEGVGYTNS